LNFTKLLASPTIASKEWITEQYDSMVRTNTLAGPGASDAAVVRIKGTKRALALATDGNGRWCYLNPKVGAMHAVAEASRNVAASGARPIAATNCLNFGSPEKPEVMWQFSQAIDGLGEACVALGAPITGGNVSFYNETLGKSIYPTPTIGILGILEHEENVLKVPFRKEGAVILLLDGAPNATTPSPAQEFSSSEYSKAIAGIVAGEPPVIDLAAEGRLIDCLVALAEAKTVQSAHDLSDGGLAVAVAECCFASKGLGAQVAVEGEANAEHALFGERGGRAIVSVVPGNVAAVLAIARQYGVGAREIGKVTRDNTLRIEYKERAVIVAAVSTLQDTWAHSLRRDLKLP
jgi:phosphoribosylformylglycinamidine synthase